MKKIIGTNALTYPEIRNFAGLDFENYSFKKVIDFYKIPAFILFKLKRKINRKWQNSFNDFGLNKAAFFHFFNVIHTSKKPYITTYETTLPRWHDTEKDFKKGLTLLAQPNCKQIIALSESAFQLQKNCIEKYAPHLLQTIMQKNCVMLPPQKALINKYEEKQLDPNFITFTIVGADFFRKGGQAILNVFEKLLTQKLPIKLNIVSSLNYGDYVSQTNVSDKEKALLIINNFHQSISYFKTLNNQQIAALLKQTHVALLPSLAETFGYFILEAQAAACPVITTDIRAMPEINNNEIGWIIPIKKENSYDADISNYQQLIANISIVLESIVLEIINNPSVIKTKGEKALQQIIDKHSVQEHREKLLAMYGQINK